MNTAKLFVFLLFTALFANAQEQPDKANFCRLALGFELTTFRNEATPNPDHSLLHVQQSVISHSGYGGNASLQYTFNHHLKIKASPGVEIRKLEYAENYDSLDFGDEFTGLGFNGIGNDPHIASYTENATFFTVPVLVTYDFDAGRFSPIISAGASPDFLLNKNEDAILYWTDDSQTSVSEQDLFRSIDLGLMFQGGVRYHASKKLSISLNGLFKYFVLQNDLITHQFNFGLGLGLQYCLK